MTQATWFERVVALLGVALIGLLWAPWFFGGFATSLILMSMAAVPMLLRYKNAQRGEKKSNAV